MVKGNNNLQKVYLSKQNFWHIIYMILRHLLALYHNFQQEIVNNNYILSSKHIHSDTIRIFIMFENLNYCKVYNFIWNPIRIYFEC